MLQQRRALDGLECTNLTAHRPDDSRQRRQQPRGVGVGSQDDVRGRHVAPVCVHHPLRLQPLEVQHARRRLQVEERAGQQTLEDPRDELVGPALCRARLDDGAHRALSYTQALQLVRVGHQPDDGRQIRVPRLEEGDPLQDEVPGRPRRDAVDAANGRPRAGDLVVLNHVPQEVVGVQLEARHLRLAQVHHRLAVASVL